MKYSTVAKIENTNQTAIALVKVLVYSDNMEVLEIKREVERLSHRLGKTQDYL
ncbi:hypothetical protein [Gloeocapsopsis dulcis]|uniref:hypothetical protein n=1 Tax=Gloeocapsopsis dulcis TaxID=2859516 RepID=UPI0018C5AC4F|nr:hypothetical protein [Gloeocapsopsis dulcis]WNN92077.1 hypothetical protein P0S91_14965 [Gloeocapsopsis dulcis]